MRAIKEAAILALVALLPATVSWARWQMANKEMAPYEVVMRDDRLSGRDIVWVDARSQADFDSGHITGAVLLNEQEWDPLLSGVFEMWQPDKPIVVYCSAGCESSRKIADRLRDLGMEPVYYLRGGYDAWKKAR